MTLTCALCGDRTDEPTHHLRVCEQRPQLSLIPLGPWNTRIVDRFWSKVDWMGYCWEWTASVNFYGYGRFCVSQRDYWLAHRFAARLYLPTWDPEFDACHSCDNPKCVRPDHLWMGDAGDNVADMVAKGRSSGQRAEVCANGHPFDHHNGSQRICLTCLNRRGREYRARRQSAETGEAIFECYLCGEKTIHLPRHFSRFHPDVDLELQTWPDGAPVIVDTTLTAADFEEGQ